MSEKTESTAEEAGEQNQAKQFDPITSQDDLDRIIQDRLVRERKKFADYDDAKAAQARLAELEEANKTEVEKAQARADKAEKELAAKTSELVRASVLSKHQIPEDYQDLVTGDTEEALTASAEKIAALVKGHKFDPLVDPKQGQTPTNSVNSEEREAVRQLFGD